MVEGNLFDKVSEHETQSYSQAYSKTLSARFLVEQSKQS